MDFPRFRLWSDSYDPAEMDRAIRNARSARRLRDMLEKLNELARQDRADRSNVIPFPRRPR
jgi:hypothetical protein